MKKKSGRGARPSSRAGVAGKEKRSSAERVPFSRFAEGRAWSWFGGLLLLAATIAVYQQSWGAGFIWDDDIYVTKNPLLTASDGLKRIWFSLDSPSQYFPLVYTSFRLEHALWGLNPAGFHWVNILLHGLNAILVWRLLRALRIPGAWLAAALFALHPVQVESVAWITERKNVLMGFFFLLTLLSWTRFIAEEIERRWEFYAAALVFYALALSSKTTACTIPVALLLILWLKRKRIDLPRWLELAPFLVLGLIAGLISIWWERNHQGTQGQLFAVAFPDRILVASHAIWFYLGKLAWPAGLAFSYPRWNIAASDPAVYIWPALTVAALLLVWFGRRFVGRGLEVALLFFVATLAPMLGFVMLYTFRYSWVADHYQYLASIGPLALAAAGLTTAWNRFEARKANLIAVLIGAALLVSLGMRTWKQAGIYANEDILWRATLEVNPGSWMAHNNLGIRLAEAGRFDEAIAQYRTALRWNPEYSEAYFNLGNAYLRTGRLEDARANYLEALRLYPQFAAARANLGDVLVRLGRMEEGITQLEAAAAMDSKHTTIYSALGTAYAKTGNSDKAIAIWKKAIEANPEDVIALSKLGIALAQSERPEEALPYLKRTAELETKSAEAHYNLANALASVGRKEEAIVEYKAALKIQDAYPAAHNNLAGAFAETGRVEEAIAEYNRVLELNPNNRAAHKNLATILRRLGRTEEALSHSRQAGEP